jgi:hypothetical protein
LDFPPQASDGGSSANGTWTFQNSTPTDLRFQNSEPGFGDTAPYSARTYANFAGSIGKQSEIQAPADFARPYQTDLDNSRPGVLAPRLEWTGGPNITFNNTLGGSVVNTQIQWPVDTSLYGLGGIVQTVGGTDAGYWLYTYDPISKHMAPQKRLNMTGFGNTWVGQPQMIRVSWGAPTIRETSGHIYVPVAGGGVIDAALPYSGGPTNQTPIQTGTKFWHIISFGGYIMTFEASDPTGVKAGMTISLRKVTTTYPDPTELDVHTPASLSGIDAAPELGNAPIREVVPDWLFAHPPVVYGGAVYICSDRQVLKVVFDDENCRILSVPIHTDFTRITGNPAIFQGSLFVPSGNTLWKWTPGQLEMTPIPVDNFGDLPANRGGGLVVALQPVAQGLMITTMSNPAFPVPPPPIPVGGDSTLLMMDSQNVFQMIDYSPASGVARDQYSLRLVYFVDQGYDSSGSAISGPSVGFICTDLGPVKRVIGRRESNRDPAYLPKESRHQVAGSHWWISPLDPGVGYGDLKAALKVAVMCADVSPGTRIRIYYQTDYEPLLADQIIGGYTGATTGTLMELTGRWHCVLTLDGSALHNPDGSAAPLLFQTPNGGFAGYTELSLIPAGSAPAITYRSIRWAVEIESDHSTPAANLGTLYPRLLGFKTYYSETPVVYVVHSLRARILAGDPDLASVPSLAPKTADDVYAQYNTLWGYAKSGTFVPWLDPNGVTRMVKITKFVFNAVDLLDTPDGLPQAVPPRRRVNKMVLQLALQEAESAA